jgi:hypothetical protein
LIPFARFAEQVIPFLPPDLAAYHGTPAGWQAMVGRVRADLAGAVKRGGA